MTSQSIAAATRPDAAIPATSRSRRSRRIAIVIVGLVDAWTVVLGGIVPALIYAKVAGLAVSWPQHIQACLVTGAIVYFILANAQMYDTTRLHDLPIAPSRLLTALVVACIAVLGLGLPFGPKDVHLWIWYAVWVSASFTMLLGVRIVAHHALKRLTAAGHFDTSIAVYGGGVIAERVQSHLADPRLGIRFAGVFDDRQEANRIDPTTPTVTGRLDDLVALARSGRLDQIIIALPQAADRRTAMIARQLEPLPVSVHIVTHIVSDLVDEGPLHNVSNIGPVGLLDVKSKPFADWARIVKKVEDYVLGGILLVLALPLMALIAVAIRLDSPGPIMFRQARRGFNLVPFDVLKFRTMSVIETGADIRQATENDPRVTRVGRILRRFSLDELPQLVNVMRGEMSLVGPRPHAVVHDDRFSELLARYTNRHQVLPGVTGLAQARGFRGETETVEKLEQRIVQDLEYIRTWSLWLDLKILAMTFVRVLTGHNAH